MSQSIQWQGDKMRGLGLYQTGRIVDGLRHMEARDRITGRLFMLALAESFVEAERYLFAECLKKRLNEENDKSDHAR